MRVKIFWVEEKEACVGFFSTHVECKMYDVGCRMWDNKDAAN